MRNLSIQRWSGKKRWLCGVVVFVLSFLVVGFALSDAVFFKRLVRQHHIMTPDDAWEYVGSHTIAATIKTPIESGLSARYMLTQKKALYCDEGALLMATLLRETGYRSRLVDLLGHDGISHHTVLEVQQDGRWYVYDTFLRLRHSPLTTSARGCDYELARAVRRPSWSLYRSLVYYNGFIKYLVFKMRGIKG